MELLDEGKLKNAAVVLYAKKVFPQYAQCALQTKSTYFSSEKQTYRNIQVE